MFVCFFQAEDGIRDLVRSRGLGDVYKRQGYISYVENNAMESYAFGRLSPDLHIYRINNYVDICLLYTSDAADDLLCVDLGGRRIIKKTIPG